MNIVNLNSELKFVNRIGQTLSVEERTYLQTSVEALSGEYYYERFNFWGRIEGVSKNYYIVEGVNYKGCLNFPAKKFFWRYFLINYPVTTILNSHNYPHQDNNSQNNLLMSHKCSPVNMKKFSSKQINTATV